MAGWLIGLPLIWIGLILLIARMVGVSRIDDAPLDYANPYARLEKGARK